MPILEEFMTPLPVCAEPGVSAQRALDVLERHGIRHLPVRQGDEVIGVASDREIKVASLFPGPGTITVGDIATAPYFATPEMPLEDIVGEMIEHRRDCVLVRDTHGSLVGIFTDVDAMRALRELLQDLERIVASSAA